MLETIVVVAVVAITTAFLIFSLFEDSILNALSKKKKKDDSCSQ